MSPPTLVLLVLLGLAVGSFLNVVIVRLPEGRPLTGRSACPACRAAIAWYDNVPLLSFAALGGRCRACRAPIAWRYPLVEAITGALFGLAYLVHGTTPRLVIALGVLAALVAITAIDLAHQIIPDVITLPGMAAGVVASLVAPGPSWTESLAGLAVGGGIFWLIRVVYAAWARHVRGQEQEGMGGGDVKLGAMLGAFLGWPVVLLAILLAVLSGGVVALLLLGLGLTGRKEPIPFGPFLALGGAVGVLAGDAIIGWYLAAFP